MSKMPSICQYTQNIMVDFCLIVYIRNVELRVPRIVFGVKSPDETALHHI